MYFGSLSDPSQTAVAEAKPRYIYSILKPHGQSSRCSVRLLLSEAKPSYIYLILKPHGQSFRGPVRLLLGKEKPSYPAQSDHCVIGKAKAQSFFTFLELVPSSFVR